MAICTKLLFKVIAYGKVISNPVVGETSLRAYYTFKITNGTDVLNIYDFLPKDSTNLADEKYFIRSIKNGMYVHVEGFFSTKAYLTKNRKPFCRVNISAKVVRIIDKSCVDVDEFYNYNGAYDSFF